MMYNLKHTILGLALLLSFSALSQTPHQVINSAGTDRPAASGSLTLTDNVGEVFVQTVDNGNSMITQGFLQKFNVVPGVRIDFLINHVTCAGKKDGNITISLSNSQPSYTLTYIWSDTTLCPQNNCDRLDSLGADTLVLTVLVTRPLGGNSTVTDTVTSPPIIVRDEKGPCKVFVYTGITANNDNINDFLYVKDIELYPDNRMSIYNRWGNILFDRNKYDNLTVRWPEEEDLRTLTSGTYFYILELGTGETQKGWVELLKN